MYLNKMNDNSILLIGNGPSVINHKMGDIINNHLNVCRFNSFKIDQFEKNVGTKCDIWVTCLDEPYVIKKASLFKKIYFPLYQEKFIKMTKCFSNSECFPPHIYKNASMINGKDKWFYPSSGLMATLFFLERGMDVILYGFDFFQKEKHHYCDSQSIGPNHSPSMEFLTFTKLLNEKKVKLLHESSNTN